MRGLRKAANGGGSVGGWPAVERELDRSRRYGRGFALLALPSADQPEAVTAELRSLDVAWQERGLLYVLLPESGRDAAAALLGRLAAIAPALATREHAGIAVFPEDGLTSGALRACLAEYGGAHAPERKRNELDIAAVLRAAARVTERERAAGKNGNGNGAGDASFGHGPLRPATEAYRAAPSAAAEPLQ